MKNMALCRVAVSALCLYMCLAEHWVGLSYVIVAFHVHTHFVFNGVTSQCFASETKTLYFQLSDAEIA